jgi:hypothetical protein
MTTKQDVQVINGIEYPYVTSNGLPARIICQDRIAGDSSRVVYLVLDFGKENIETLRQDLKVHSNSAEPYLKPYVKPHVKPSIFEGLKPGTVVFCRYIGNELITDAWEPLCFLGVKPDGVLDQTGNYCLYSHYEFQLDNPYLEAPETPVEEPWIEWKGGEKPVEGYAMVDVKFRYGAVCENSPACSWFWEHSGSDDDIVAYRPA